MYECNIFVHILTKEMTVVFSIWILQMSSYKCFSKIPTALYIYIFFIFLEYIEVEMLGHRVYLVQVSKKLSSSFQNWLLNFTFPLAVGPCFSCYTFSPTFTVVGLFNFRCHCVCDVVSHLTLRFPVHKL